MFMCFLMKVLEKEFLLWNPSFAVRQKMVCSFWDISRFSDKFFEKIGFSAEVIAELSDNYNYYVDL